MSGITASPLRTPFVLAIVLMIVLWSMLSLDMTSVTTAPINTAPTQQEIPEPIIPSSSTEALRLAAEAAAKAQQDAPVVDTPVVEAAPVVADPTPEQPTDVAEKEGSKEEASNPTPSPSSTSSTQTPTDRPLILYAYADSKTGSARTNIEFFIEHALHDAADFIFILNGETDVSEIIPDKKNIRYVQRANDCYDLGAYAEVLLKDDLYKGYKRFITLNASIRGPFMPYWSNGCWSDLYLSKITDEVKLVGMTANCWPTFHIQSMIWATDITGMETLLFPPEEALAYLRDNPITLPPTGQHDNTDPENTVAQSPGINGCFHTWDSAVAAEVSSSSLIRAAGYKVDAMMNAFQGQKAYRDGESCSENKDVLFNGGYWGTNVNVFETIFMKSNRDVDPENLDRQSEWVKGRGYKSYDYCKI